MVLSNCSGSASDEINGWRQLVERKRECAANSQDGEGELRESNGCWVVREGGRGDGGRE